MAFYLFGAGLGFSMQIIVTIVQNAVDRRHMGTATSSVAFFRSMGGTFGAAVFGAILSSRLDRPPGRPDRRSGGAPGAVRRRRSTGNVQAIQQLPEPVHGLVLNAFADSLHDVFLWAIPVVVIASVVSFFIKEVPLKMRSEPGAPAEAEEVSLAHSEGGAHRASPLVERRRWLSLSKPRGFDKLNRRVAPRAG